MLVTNPRRAREGGSLGVADFPGLDLDAVRWATADDGSLAVELVETRPLTDAEKAEAVAVAEALGPVDKTLRERARAAYAVNRNFRDNLSPQLLTGADVIVNDPTITQAEAVGYIRDLARAVRVLTSQVESLARQNIALGRIVLADLDGTE